MNNSEQNIRNYFDALNEFLKTWLKAFESTLGGEKGDKDVKKTAESFTRFMQDSLDSLENSVLEQQKMLNEMSPQDMQSQMLESMDKFNQAFDESVQIVKEAMKKQQEYVSSDQFLEDVEDNASRSQAFYNNMLGGMTDMVKKATNSMK